MSETISSTRKLKPSEVRAIRKARRQEEEQIAGGRVDVEPSIDSSHIDDIETRRRVLKKVQPSLEEQPAGAAFNVAKEAERQAREIDQELANQEDIAFRNIQDAEEQLALLQENPEGFTIDGEPITKSKLAELRSNIEQYKKELGEFRTQSVSQSSELKGKAGVILDQISDWARNVAERNEAVDKKKADFNQLVTQSIGIGSSITEKPKLTKLQREFGVTGIPGPAAGPAPGSFGEKLQNRFGVPATQKVKSTLSSFEAPFVSATTPLRARGEKLREEAGAEPPSFAGLSKFLAGAALATGASAFDAATIGLRPGLVLKSAVSAGSLVDPEVRAGVGETIRADPFTFAAEIGGTLAGANLGAKLSDIGKTMFRERGPIIRTLKAGGTPRQAFAVARRSTARLDFNKLLREEINLYEFPSEVIEAEPFEIYTKFKAREIKPEFRRIIDPFDFRMDTARGEFTQLGRGGTLIRTGGGIMEVPIQVPESMTLPMTLLRRKIFSLVAPSGRPRIPISFAAVSSLPKTGTSLAGVLSGANIASKTKSIQRLKITQIQKPGTVQQNLQRFNQILAQSTRNILAPPSGISISGIKSVSATIPKSEPIQGGTQINIPIPQIDIPIFTPPEPGPTPKRPTPFFFKPRPPRSTKNVLSFDPRKKKKAKRGKRVKKKVIKKRIDPLGIINWDPRKKR